VIHLFRHLVLLYQDHDLYHDLCLKLVLDFVWIRELQRQVATPKRDSAPLYVSLYLGLLLLDLPLFLDLVGDVVVDSKRPEPAVRRST
jgi:hypothetical protein